jgi:hypothetical protein
MENRGRWTFNNIIHPFRNFLYNPWSSQESFPPSYPPTYHFNFILCGSYFYNDFNSCKRILSILLFCIKSNSSCLTPYGDKTEHVHQLFWGLTFSILHGPHNLFCHTITTFSNILQVIECRLLVFNRSFNN